MAFLTQWLRRPQNVWLRRALFQVHLWSGLILGLYVFAICVSGSILVYRVQLEKRLTPPTIHLAVSGPRLTPDQMNQAVMRVYPGYSIERIDNSDEPDLTSNVFMQRGSSHIQRQFNPYTGEDLGRTVPVSIDMIEWLVEFHSNLHAGAVGIPLNGIGGIVLAMLAVTGAVIWWPGISSWKRSLTVGWRGSWKQFNWALHSAFGIWTLLFVLMWGLTGAYLIFPEPIERGINHFSPILNYQPLSPEGFRAFARNAPKYPPGSWRRRIYGQRQLSFGEKLIRWFSLLHFGRLPAAVVQGPATAVLIQTIMVLWAILGLAPPLLFVTGALMWWNRVLNPYLHRLRVAAPAGAGNAAPVGSERLERGAPN